MATNRPTKSKTPAQMRADPVASHIDRIVDLWAAGEPFDAIAAALKVGLTGPELRSAVVHNPELVKRLNAENDLRANMLVDQALTWAYAAAATGDPSGYRVGIDTLMKLAAKIDPKTWGDVKKVELTGKSGRPLQVRADMSLSPADAYARLVQGS